MVWPIPARLSGRPGHRRADRRTVAGKPLAGGTDGGPAYQTRCNSLPVASGPPGRGIGTNITLLYLFIRQPDGAYL